MRNRCIHDVYNSKHVCQSIEVPTSLFRLNVILLLLKEQESSRSSAEVLCNVVRCSVTFWDCGYYYARPYGARLVFHAYFAHA